MVYETRIGEKSLFECMKCGWLYNNLDMAKKCEEYCKKHKSCNLKIIKHAIKIGGKRYGK